MQRLSYIATGIVLALSSSAVLAADPPTNPNILQGVQQLQTSVQQLQVNDAQTAATLQGIQSALADLQKAVAGLTPAPIGNVLVTPFLAQATATSVGQEQDFVCVVTNLTTASRTLKLEIINASGTLISSFSDFPLQAGVTLQAGPPQRVPSGIMCRVTVQNGTKTDVAVTLTRIISSAQTQATVDTATVHAQ